MTALVFNDLSRQVGRYQYRIFMNQHSIQEAYLRKFCVNGKLWAHDINKSTVFHKPVSQCTTESDFQSEILEKIQNVTIESPGIKALRKLLDGKSITSEEYDLVRYWTALHILRNQKIRNTPDMNYKADYNSLIKIENKFSLSYFQHCYKYKCNEGKYFITSDNPVIEICVAGDIVRFLTISPDELLIFTPFDNTIYHEELEFTELINSTLWANAYKEVYSNLKELPYLTYVANLKRWNLGGL